MENEGERMILVDGHSLIHRAFYALPTLTTSDGTPTHAVLGFTKMLMRLLKDEKPRYAAVAFDRPTPTFRHRLFEGYKEDRDKTPSDLATQIPWTKRTVQALGLALYEAEGYEADDIIGTLARVGEKENCRILVVTGDKDLLQVVSTNTEVLLTRRGISDVTRYDVDTVRRDLGITPSQVPDLKGFVGDASDSIPGVKGIGEKTARKLLAEYKSVEGVLEAVDELKGRAKKALEAQGDMARLSKELATIDRQVPLDVDLSLLRYDGPNVEQLGLIFRELEFRSLLKDLVKDYPEAAATNKTMRVKSEGDTHIQRDGNPSKPISKAIVINDDGDVDVLTQTMADADLIAVQVETGSVHPLSRLISEVTLTIGATTWILPFNSDRPVYEGHLNAIVSGMNASSARRVAYDAKRVYQLFQNIGFELDRIDHDLMLADYLINPGQGDHSLEDLALKYQEDYPTSPQPEARGHLMIRLASKLQQAIAGRDQIELYEEIELPLAKLLADMERNGIAVDVTYLRDYANTLQEEIKSVQTRIEEIAGEPFNLNSPKQLGRILFEKLGLPVLAKTKTGPSTGAEVLEELAKEHEIAQLIMEYRRKQKLKSVYLDALPSLVDEETGRVHTTYHQTVTATGRLSSSNPNLQNIPVRSDEGRRIRKAFVAAPGRCLLIADYSQIELRVLAHISQDQRLISAFKDGADIHALTASEIFGVDRPSRSEREAAKAVNFGIVYGISGFGLAKGIDRSPEEAAEFIKEYLKRYPQVARYMEDVVEQGRKKGYVQTIFGRRRYLPELNSRRYPQRRAAERAAINMPIQGSAADIIKRAMIAVYQRLQAERLKAQMLLQVHDELVFEVSPDDLKATALLVKEEMEGAASLRVPLKVELTFGPNWLEGRPFKED